jgi:hypothetical protein
MNKSAYAVVAILVVFLSTSLVHAQNGYGNSSIALTPSNNTVAPGQSTSVAYQVKLANGNTWGTTLQVSNKQNLSADGITVTISNPSGNPPYSGNATISTSSSTAAASYTITFVATGDDPSINPSSFTLTVRNGVDNGPPPTPGNSTTIFTHPPVNGTVPLWPLIISILAVIVTFVVIAAALKFATK